MAERMKLRSVALALLVASAIAPIGARAQPSDWRSCMARCQHAIDRMNPAHALSRQALADAIGDAQQRIQQEWPVRDCVLGLQCDLGLPPHFELKGDEGKSLEQFERCLTLCGKP